MFVYVSRVGKWFLRIFSWPFQGQGQGQMHCTTTFHLYLISLHIETKLSCFKGVNASRFLQIAFQWKKSEKNKKKWFWGALASILRISAVLFPHKTMKIEQFMNYLNKNFSYSPRMTLYKITLTYEKIVYALSSAAVSMTTTIFCLQIFESNRFQYPPCTRWFISSYFYDQPFEAERIKMQETLKLVALNTV